jgi:GrxC family glutaredoxin
MMRHIEIYSTQQCPYCVRARALLDAKGLDFEEIDVSVDQQILQYMIERSGQRTVPQIFIDGESVGGFQQLARISHQAASDTDKTLVIKRDIETIKNTECYSSLPITVQAGLRVRKLALHSNRSYGYAFRSRAALTNTNPAPAPVILVRNAG